MILELTKYTLNNSVIHYRGIWYKSKEGAPTGGPESPSIANIHVKYVLDEKILKDQKVMKLNKMDNRSRFLDDIWALWGGTVRTFEMFLTAVNIVGEKYGITFTGESGKSVVFLDVTTKFHENDLVTTMYTKPTDSIRYLHRRSGHSHHTFSGIPFSQFRRAVVICSSVENRNECVEKMEKKFLDSGYKPEELSNAKSKALKLDRTTIFRPVNETVSTAPKEDNLMAFVINQHSGLRQDLNSFFKEHQEDLNRLLGETRFVVSEKKHQTIASLLFGKASFSRVKPTIRSSQMCRAVRCKSCETMNLPKKIMLNGFLVKLDFSCDCSTDSAV